MNDRSLSVPFGSYLIVLIIPQYACWTYALSALGQAFESRKSHEFSPDSLSCRCADYVLLNKRDMLVNGELESLIEIVHTLNPLAQVCCYMMG